MQPLTCEQLYTLPTVLGLTPHPTARSDFAGREQDSHDS
jgi:hypothetical protein